MTSHPTLSTPRLVLRAWKQDDLPAFAALNADPHVMQFFPKLLSRAESDAMAQRIREHFDQHGFGLWSVELPGIAQFIDIADPFLKQATGMGSASPLMAGRPSMPAATMSCEPVVAITCHRPGGS